MFPPKLKKIRRFYTTQRRMPSYSEIMNLAGFKSKNAAYKLVTNFVASGHLKRDHTGKILPGPAFNAIRVLGVIHAGFPNPAEEELLDTINLDEYLIQKREATYMIKAVGDSMVDAGILDGDLVLVERRGNAKPGQIVVAEVDGEWTIKYLRKQGSRVFLDPANEKYKPIHPQSELKVHAVVIAVIRKY